MKRRRAFSMAELMTVIAVILLLISLLLTGTNHLMGRASMLQCQNRLAQIGQAARMFVNDHRQWPEVYNRETYERWYEALAIYMDGSREVFNCPLIDMPVAGEHETAGPSESDLPMLLYNTAAGRDTGLGWAQWSRYTRFRNWYDENIEYGLFLVQADENTLTRISSDHLSAASQVWFIHTESFEYNRGGQVFANSELDAIRSFFQRGGGIHALSEAYRQDDYYRSTNEVLAACNVGMVCLKYTPATMVHWNLVENDHPVMRAPGGGYVRDMRSAGSIIHFHITGDDTYGRIIGQGRVTNYSGDPVSDREGTVADGEMPNLIAAWDDGMSRMLLHSSYTSFASEGYNLFPWGDIEQYSKNADAWLRRSGGMRPRGHCSYGYNSLVGMDARRPAADTIIVMDYADWRIRRNQEDPDRNDPPAYIATRHTGRANALMGDGSVRALHIEDIREGMWTPEHGD